MGDIIMAATEWATNASMIADVARLGYLKKGQMILDPTYGKGGWWRVWYPWCEETGGGVIGHTWGSMSPYDPTLQNWDFRKMWYKDETFDAVAFDPPYVCPGGRASSTIQGMHDAYGMGTTPYTPAAVQADINLGLAECFRVVKKGGIVLVKCQDYVSSGKLWPGTHFTLTAAFDIGFQLVDRLEHISGPRPQPERETQQHARRNYSTLFVLRRPKR